jgi:hypothetical protein
MSNKQSMKLYTEEELRKHLYNHDESFFEKLTPIELPSDEEIKQESDEFELNSKVSLGMHISFENGAKWMRDKIQGGNNEQR